MGISTFAHLLTQEEMEALKACECSDEVLNGLLKALCNRPFIGREEEEQQEEGGGVQEVNVVATLKELLEADNGIGNHVRLEQKTKYWEATLSGWNVTFNYGKKKTAGQTNIHSGPDAREYFDKKVKEKLRGGYKMVGGAAKAGARKKALEVLERVGGSEPTTKKAKGSVKHRADFDKAAELVTFLLARELCVNNGPLEMLGRLFPSESLGVDVCYGPVYLVSPAAVAEMYPRIAAVSTLQLTAQFDKGDFPDVLGGLCDVSKERDLDYALIHFGNLKALLSEANDFHCGLLLHFW